MQVNKGSKIFSIMIQEYYVLFSIKFSSLLLGLFPPFISTRYSILNHFLEVKEIKDHKNPDFLFLLLVHLPLIITTIKIKPHIAHYVMIILEIITIYSKATSL